MKGKNSLKACSSLLLLCQGLSRQKTYLRVQGPIDLESKVENVKHVVRSGSSC